MSRSPSGSPVVIGSADGTTFAAFAAHATAPGGTGVIILPDACGLGQPYSELALRFASEGIDAVAIDCYGRTAGLGERKEGFDWERHLTLARAPSIAADVAGAAAFLRAAENGACRTLFTVGFGFGASHSWLQAANGHGLAGAVGFCGQTTPPMPDDSPAPIERASEMACPVLAIFGGIDPVAALLGIGGFHAALKAAGVLHEIAVYPATPHSFFDRLASAHRKASEDAWERTLGFLRSVSKGGTSHLPRYVIVDGLAQQTVKGVTRGSPPPYTGTGRRYPPPESGGGWPVLGERREIAARGVDPERLEEFAQWNLTVQHEPPAPPSHVGCLVIKDGFIVQERYDLPRTRTWPRWIASIGKSISSCAFGRWIEAGRRGGARFRIELDSPVYDPAYLPEGFPLSDPRKEQITFSHLLTHTSGLLPEPDIKGGPEGFRYVDFTVGRCKVYPQTARLKFDPGKGYGYSSVGFSHFALMAPHLTGGMLHQEVFDRILGPIGVESAAWRLPDGWGSPYEDEQGRYMPASGGPHITTRDLARYAYLHLCDGRWEGRIVVPQWYMRQARQVVRINEVQPDNYGLGFWSNSLLGMSRDLPRDAFGFGGAGLNLVVVVPSRDLIAVRTSWVWTAEFNRVAAEFFRWVAALTH